MIAPRTSTVLPKTTCTLDSARELVDNPLCTIDGNLLALACRRRRAGPHVPAEALRAGLTALEGAGTRALVRERRSGAVAGPATVAGCGTAGGLAAAFYVGGVVGAAAGNGYAA
jgi:hypothetical protein